MDAWPSRARSHCHLGLFTSTLMWPIAAWLAREAAASDRRLRGESVIDPFLLFGAVVAIGAGAGAYALGMRDLIRRGRLHRRNEQLVRRGELPQRPDGRVACPECGEAILPGARRCPYCRSVVQPRGDPQQLVQRPPDEEL